MHPGVWTLRPSRRRRPVREVHVDAAERVDDVGEGVEVEQHGVLDRDAQILLDGVDELVRPLVERGVDLVGALRPGVRDEEVARDREHRDRVVRPVEVQDHDHVAVDAVDACEHRP